MCALFIVSEGMHYDWQHSHTQLWEQTPQGWLGLTLVQIGPVVSGEDCFLNLSLRRQTNHDGSLVMAKAHDSWTV